MQDEINLRPTVFRSKQVAIQQGHTASDPYIVFSPQVTDRDLSPERLLQTLAKCAEDLEFRRWDRKTTLGFDVTIPGISAEYRQALAQWMAAVRDVAYASGFTPEATVCIEMRALGGAENSQLHIDEASEAEQIARFNLPFGPGTEFHPEHKEPKAPNSSAPRNYFPRRVSCSSPTPESGGVQARPGYMVAFDITAGHREGSKGAWHKAPDGDPRGYISATIKESKPAALFRGR